MLTLVYNLNCTIVQALIPDHAYKALYVVIRTAVLTYYFSSLTCMTICGQIFS